MAPSETLQAFFDSRLAPMDGVVWSVAVEVGDTGTGVEYQSDRCLKTASVGKIILLIELAARVEAGVESEQAMISRDRVKRVGGSGFLQFLDVDQLSIHDLAVLVAASSDNLATNLLLDRVGLEAVNTRAATLGLKVTALHDRVRDDRGPSDPPTLSSGSAAELCQLISSAVTGRLVTPYVSARLRSWLSINADTSMVAAAFDLDPLEHAFPPPPDSDPAVEVDQERQVQQTDGPATLSLFNKTGTDDGVRADVGWVSGGGRDASYAVLANWSSDLDQPLTARVLATMRDLGDVIRSSFITSRDFS